MAQSHINRRDFLKLSSLLALSAPAANIIGKSGGDLIVESHEEFGGFAIRMRPKDDPPYIIDDSIYKRPDSRKSLDPLKMNMMADNALLKLESKAPGYTRYECAFHCSAWTVAMGLGTNGAQTNAGLYSWSVIPNA